MTDSPLKVFFTAEEINRSKMLLAVKLDQFVIIWKEEIKRQLPLIYAVIIFLLCCITDMIVFKP